MADRQHCKATIFYFTVKVTALFCKYREYPLNWLTFSQEIDVFMLATLEYNFCWKHGFEAGMVICSYHDNGTGDAHMAIFVHPPR